MSRGHVLSRYPRTRSVVKPLVAAEAVASPAIRVLGSEQIVPLSGERFTVGAGARNSLVLRGDPYVSKQHCALYWDQGELWICDEGSRNGTWVNDLRVERCRVWPGVRVVCGRTGLELSGDAPAPRSYGMVGQHPSMLRVIEQVRRFGPTLRPVLILGETGTGKELVARALHAASPCRSASFEALNCGAIARELAESELFGHTEGAFTGASRARKGAFERADGGTLFLDEVGEMPLELQPKLLRVLEQGEVQPVGGERSRPVAVRVVAATHCDLQRQAQQGRFRLDLFHRLAVGVIEVPPLRDRPEDIPLLVQHFLTQERSGRWGGGQVPVTIPPKVVRYLQQQRWQGNVRELRHAVQRAVMEGGAELTTESFRSARITLPDDAGRDSVRFRGRSFSSIRREIYARVLQEHGGNCAGAALALGIPKSTFFDQARSLGLHRPGRG